jgi:hypothetical protein
MYSIERTTYGFRLTFGGKIPKAEMAAWVGESTAALAGVVDKFGVFVDMRELQVLDADAQAEMKKGQVAYKTAGMERSVVILANPVVTMQFKRIARETGIDAWERYLDASSTPTWEQVGVAWVERGVDPGK